MSNTKRTLIMLLLGCATALLSASGAGAQQAALPPADGRTVVAVHSDAGKLYVAPGIVTTAVAVPQTRSLTPPVLDEAGSYVARLLSLAVSNEWNTVAGEVQRLGGDPTSVNTPPAAAAKAELDLERRFGGVLTPSRDREVVKSQLDRFAYLGFDCPVLLATDLKDGWQETYDITFGISQGRIGKPILGLCIGRMSVPELLRIPEFLRRYQGKFHSVVANYDLTTTEFERTPDAALVRRGMDRVGLVLALVRRADPALHVWLATGYTGRPSWPEWLKAQDKSAYDGIALTGPSAVLACMHPEVARKVTQKIAKEMPEKPVSLMGFSEPFLSPQIKRNDDHAVKACEELRGALRGCGFVLVHTEEE